jgi:hypothetical protein
LGELRHNLESHLDDLSPMQRVVMVETFFAERQRAEVAQCHGISPSTYANHLQAVFRTRRASLQGVVDYLWDIEVPPWYDGVEELIERRAAAQRHRLSRKNGKRSSCGGKRANSGGERANSRGDRSNFEDDASNSRRDADKHTRVAHDSVGSTTES